MVHLGTRQAWSTDQVVMIGRAIVAVANAVIVLVTAFGLSLTANQIGAILLTVNAVIALGSAVQIWLSSKKKPTNGNNVKVAEDRSIG